MKLYTIRDWFRRLGDNRFLIGPNAGRKGWVGGTDKIIFNGHPDPINMDKEQRNKAQWWHMGIPEDPFSPLGLAGLRKKTTKTPAPQDDKVEENQSDH